MLRWAFVSAWVLGAMSDLEGTLRLIQQAGVWLHGDTESIFYPWHRVRSMIAEPVS